MERDKPVYLISAVSKMFNIHAQTLRLYEREGLVTPSRTDGNTRLYSENDIERLEQILSLTRDMGVNLAGIDIILGMRQRQRVENEKLALFLLEVKNLLRKEAPQLIEKVEDLAQSSGLLDDTTQNQ